MTKRSNPFDHAQSDWLSMQDELDRANEETRQAKQVSIQLLAEVAMLKADLATANKDLRFWRTYGVRIETRLEVMQEVITSAREEAREHAREEVAELPKTEPEAVLEAPKVILGEPSAATATFNAFNGTLYSIQPRLADPVPRPVRELWAEASDEPESFDGRPRALTNNWP